MNKLKIFFLLNFLITIIFQTSVFIENGIKNNNNILFGFLKKELLDKPPINYYMLISGLNTGYGFYGINVATNKYFFIEAYDVNHKLLKKFDLTNFQTKNSYSRFTTLPSWLSNFKEETLESLKKDSTKKNKEYCVLRKKYLKKIYEYTANYAIKDIKKCKMVTIKLVTILPPDIWNIEIKNNNIYVIQEYNFKTKG